MKSNKQRRAELDARKAARTQEVERARLESDRADAEANGVVVNRERLVPNNSYGEPEFARRGFYLDMPFRCVDCGVEEIWTARQQKWWYEVARGSLYTTARRCRTCRRRERDRRNEARRVSEEGLARNQAGEK